MLKEAHHLKGYFHAKLAVELTLGRCEIYLWHKELFAFNFWRFSEDTVSKLEISSFNPFSSSPSLAASSKK